MEMEWAVRNAGPGCRMHWNFCYWVLGLGVGFLLVEILSRVFWVFCFCFGGMGFHS
jgi:hypothetical protein